MYKSSVRQNFDQIASESHAKFLEFGIELLVGIREKYEQDYGRIDWDAPVRDGDIFTILPAESIRVFNHLLAYLLSKMSVDVQDTVGRSALSTILNQEEVIKNLRDYASEFGTNKFIAQKLREVGELRAREGDGRSKDAHMKAARVIENSKETITSGQEAQKLKGVGVKIAAKIDELLATGKIEILEAEAKVRSVIKEFMKIWGVNVATASHWQQDGYGSIGEIRLAARQGDIKLTKLQFLGLKHFEDFQTLMEAPTVKTVGQLVKHAAGKTRRTMIVGSYRRKVFDPIADTKRPTKEISEFRTKDVDILIVDENKNAKTLGQIVDSLAQLVDIEIGALGEHMCMGAMYISSIKCFKRFDIFICTPDELPCALLAHTGPAGYNVHMRQVASEKGWTLNEHHLLDAKDQIIEVQSEAEVQKLLGFPEDLPYDRK